MDKPAPTATIVGVDLATDPDTTVIACHMCGESNHYESGTIIERCLHCGTVYPKWLCRYPDDGCYSEDV